MELYEIAITSGGTHRTVYVPARDTTDAFNQVRDLESDTVKVFVTGHTLVSVIPANLSGVLQ